MLKSLIPPRWAERLHGYESVRNIEGKSGTVVYRLARAGLPTYYLKIAHDGDLANLAGEAARMNWLREVGVPCPKVEDLAVQESTQLLLMSALPGASLSMAAARLDSCLIVKLTANALKELHTIDVAQCPFDAGLNSKVTEARRRVNLGLVDEADFDEGNLGLSAANVLANVLAETPTSEDLVVTHGDASFSNFIVCDDSFAGLVDCSTIGLADRHQDLALSLRDVEYHLGSEWVGLFQECYGMEINNEKLAFYRNLDELF